MKFRQFQTEGIIPYQRGSGYIKSVLHPMLKIVLRVERNLKRVKRGNGKENSWRYMSRMWYLKMLVVMYLLLSYPWYKYIIIAIFCIDISKMVHKRAMRITSMQGLILKKMKYLQMLDNKLSPSQRLVKNITNKGLF